MDLAQEEKILQELLKEVSESIPLDEEQKMNSNSFNEISNSNNREDIESKDESNYQTPDTLEVTTCEESKDESNDQTPDTLEVTTCERFNIIDYMEDDNIFIKNCIDIFHRKFCAQKLHLEDLLVHEIVEKIRTFLAKLRGIGFRFSEKYPLDEIHKQVFPKEFKQKLKKKKVIHRVGLKSILIALVIREHWLHDRKIILTSSKSLIQDELDKVQEKTAFSNPSTIYKDYKTFLQEKNLSEKFKNQDEDEEVRLMRTYSIFSWLSRYFNGRNKKELFLFVGQLLEGPQDLIYRINVAGGQPNKYRQARINIFEAITGVHKRNRLKKSSSSISSALQTVSSSESPLSSLTIHQATSAKELNSSDSEDESKLDSSFLFK